MTGRLPSLTAHDVIRVLHRAGFAFHHQRGSHAYYYQVQQNRWATVPMHAGSIKKGTLQNIVRQSGIGRKQFLALL